MSGIKIKNDYGCILIDDTWKNLVLLRKVRLSDLNGVVGSYKFVMPSTDDDTRKLYSSYTKLTSCVGRYTNNGYKVSINISPDCVVWGLSYSAKPEQIEYTSSNSMDLYYWGATSLPDTLYYYEFGYDDGSVSSDKAGIRVRDSNGELIFDSGKKYMNTVAINDVKDFSKAGAYDTYYKAYVEHFPNITRNNVALVFGMVYFENVNHQGSQSGSSFCTLSDGDDGLYYNCIANGVCSAWYRAHLALICTDGF